MIPLFKIIKWYVLGIRRSYYQFEKVYDNRFDYYGDNRICYRGFRNLYFQSNENIDYYLNMIDLGNRENALTVAGSGDHIFNLVANGITEVDSFDINYLTEYLALGLKKAMIVKYSYYDL